jgi:hypothetical protein
MSAPEPIQVVRRETVAPLSERATGRLTYEVGVGASGSVYLCVVDKPLFVSVSPEAVSIAALRSLLAGSLATGEPFATRLLARAYSQRAKQNSLVLASVLCHEGLLRRVGEAPTMHACIGDWDDWTFVQRDRTPRRQDKTVGERCEHAVGTDALQTSGSSLRVSTRDDCDRVHDAQVHLGRNSTVSRLIRS